MGRQKEGTGKFRGSNKSGNTGKTGKFAQSGSEGKGKSEKQAVKSGHQRIEALPFSDLRVSVEREDQLEAVLEAQGLRMVYLDEACFSDEAIPGLLEKIHRAGKRAGLRLRRIARSVDPGKSSGELLIQMLHEDNKNRIPDAILIRCMEEVMEICTLREQLSKEMPREIFRFPEIVFDYTVYGFNKAAADVLRNLGADKLTFPIELNRRELQSLGQEFKKKDIPTELLVYGHLPMMVSANCIEKTSRSCNHKDSTEKLRDRMGKDMPVRMYCKYCYNQIFNAEAFNIVDLREEVLGLMPDSIRYDFSVESPVSIKEILRGEFPIHCTRGHFKHGVE